MIKKIILKSTGLTILCCLIAGVIVGLHYEDLQCGLITGGIPFIISLLVFLFLKIFKVQNENIYFLTPVILTLLVSLVILLKWQPSYDFSIYSGAKRKIPIGILMNFERWEFQANIMRLIYNILVIVSTASSIYVAMKIKDFDEILQTESDKRKKEYRFTKWAAFISAFCIGIISAFNFGEKANNFRVAWRNMHTAIIKYEELPEYSINDLIEAYNQSEKIIGDVKPSP